MPRAAALSLSSTCTSRRCHPSGRSKLVAFQTKATSGIEQPTVIETVAFVAGQATHPPARQMDVLGKTVPRPIAAEFGGLIVKARDRMASRGRAVV